MAAAGVYFNAGNIDGNWTIGSAGDIELGLHVKERPRGNLLDGSTGTYFADAGTCAGGGTKAKRDCEFLVNIGDLSYQGLTSKLGVYHDPGAATNYSFVGFGGTPGGAFNVGQDGLYGFSLRVFDAAGLMLDSTSMDVQVGAPVPEPETCALMLAGLAGLAGLAPVGAVARLKAAWPSGSARRSG